MEQLQDYMRQAVAQVRGLLKSNDLPTDLQLHRYMKQLVKALVGLSAEADDDGLQREIRRPFEGLWDFDRNAALWDSPLKVEHLVYILGELERLVLAGHELMREVAVREIHHDIRHLLNVDS
eukprot:TRINITY_DN18345_c0_g1_i4.p2 TRINITY_DN18345_c0_g1~~TRINITY_DN18345_c0_g1_i4.p2  ORF type:complete len:122 (-),score=41.05 TRINITY_DN18345_c0_g1_i4:256-621(-)